MEMEKILNRYPKLEKITTQLDKSAASHTLSNATKPCSHHLLSYYSFRK